MKKTIFLITVLLLHLQIQADTWNGSASDKSWFDETKSEFHINDAAQLKGLADIVNDGTFSFKGTTIYLENDIDMNNHPWVPIGYDFLSPKYFCGTFNGNGHSISNLYISTSKLTGTYYGTGFFGLTENATFLNLNVQGVIDHNSTNSIGSYVGGLVGYARGCNIENVKCKVDILFNSNPGGDISIGNIAGQALNISKSKSEGKLSFYNYSTMGSGYIGGIAGVVEDKVEECFSNVQMIIPHNMNVLHVGGIVGMLGKSIKNSIFTGSISVNYNGGTDCILGGICSMSGVIGDIDIENVISAPSYFYSYSKAYNTCLIHRSGTPNVTNAYYATTYAGSYETYGTGVSEDYLKSGEPLEGFDTKIWKFKPGEYPSLKVFSNEPESDIVDEYGRINGVYYKLYEDEKEASVIAGEIKYSGDIVIKDTIVLEGVKYVVKSISESAFSKCTSLTSVKIPNSIISIGSSAFRDCSILASVIIGNNVNTISQNAFSGCLGLTSIRIPASVKNISANPFAGCDGLTSIIVDEGNTMYKSPNNCNAIISTGEKLISGCKNTVIPDDVKVISPYAFDRIVSLNNISIPNSVNTIGAAAFSGCVSLTSIIMPNSVNTIGESAFQGCTKLNSIKLGENTKEIYRYAFDGCSSLDSMFIPKNVSSIGMGVFNGCSSLNTVVVDGDNKVFDSRDNCNAIIKTSDNSLVAGCKNTIIPQGITTIESYAFSRCTDLTSIIIPNSITSIKERAFLYCTSLSSIALPENINYIGSDVFAGCKELKEVFCCAEKLPEIVSTPFIDDTLIVNTILYVPNQSVELYKGSNIWNKFKDIRPLSDHPFALSYFVDGELYKTYNLEYKTKIDKESEPSKEGYTFSGWSEIPETMPAHDVTVSSTFTINKYKLTYNVDGEEYKTYEIEYGATITPIDEPTKEGYTFSGWSYIPSKMPAEDVIITGTFTANKYKLTYVVDGEEYKTEEVAFEAIITPEAEPTKEGYTFSGWSWIPSKMPAEDVTIYGTFTINKYTITYMIDGEIYTTVEVEYSSKIIPPTVPQKEGYEFAWGEYPETMPAKDIIINGTYTTTGIDAITLKEGKYQYYTLDGYRIETLRKGLNIVRTSDGKIKKIVIK